MRYRFKNIYLAGKISKNDWRHAIVEDLKRLSPQSGNCNDIYKLDDPWPVAENVIHRNFNYVGPYFIADDHGCFHGEDSHGVGADHEETDNHGCVMDNPMLAWTVDHCKRAIYQSDLVFAWIDDESCYGTLVELGYAKALGKIIWIAGPTRYRDLWFGYEMADVLWISDEISSLEMSPEHAFDAMLVENARSYYVFDSPIEQQFWDAWIQQYAIDLVPQYPIDRYFVDFAHLETKTAIELDGFATHSSTEDIANDRRRQRKIESMGWRVIRFGGKEIYNDVHRCIKETFDILQRHTRDTGNKPNYDGNIHIFKGMPGKQDGRPVELDPNDPHTRAQEYASYIDRQYFLNHPGEANYIRAYIEHEMPDIALPTIEMFVKSHPEFADFTSDEASIEPERIIVHQIREGHRERRPDGYVINFLTEASASKAEEKGIKIARAGISLLNDDDPLPPAIFVLRQTSDPDSLAQKLQLQDDTTKKDNTKKVKAKRIRKQAQNSRIRNRR